MYRYTFRLFLVGLLLLVGPSAWAKKRRYLPTGIYVGVDFTRPFYYYFYRQTGAQYEFNSAIHFARLMLEGDYGWGSTEHEGLNQRRGIRSTYRSEGRYFRVGLNYNFLKHTPANNVAFFGLRYAISFLQDHLDSKISYDNRGTIQDGQDIKDSQEGVQARWFEAVAGFKVQVWSVLYVGCTLRYKLGLKVKNTSTYLPYDIPGWGLRKEDAWDLHYYCTFRIPLVRTQALREVKRRKQKPTPHTRSRRRGRLRR